MSSIQHHSISVPRLLDTTVDRPLVAEISKKIPVKQLKPKPLKRKESRELLANEEKVRSMLAMMQYTKTALIDPKAQGTN